MDDLERLQKSVRDTAAQSELERATREVSHSSELARATRQLVSPLDFATQIPAPDLRWSEVMHQQAQDARERREAPTARRAIMQLLEEIREFESGLDDSVEVGLKLANFGPVGVVHIRFVSFRQPSMIVLIGVLEDGQTVRLVQHLSQLNCLLVAARRLAPDEPKTAIGFRTEEL